jgi:hypothetical protein
MFFVNQAKEYFENLLSFLFETIQWAVYHSSDCQRAKCLSQVKYAWLLMIFIKP